MTEYVLTEEQQRAWDNTIREGIIYQLYADKMLTDEQLKQLLEMKM